MKFIDKFIENVNLDNPQIREKKREQKLRFIEILLIIGGIIGSLGLQGESQMFGAFLIGSLLYFFTVSNLPDTEVGVVEYKLIILMFITSILITAITFSYLSILPLKSFDIALFVLIILLIVGNLWDKGILPKRC